MDKSWIRKSRLSQEYINGVKGFIEFAFASGATIDEKLKCPCPQCNNVLYQDREVAYDHMICYGFDRNYTRWLFHGEEIIPSTSRNENEVDIRPSTHTRDNEMVDLLHNAFGISNQEGDMGRSTQSVGRDLNVDAENFFRLVNDADQDLYPGCKKYTKLSFILRLFHIKCLSGWSNKSFSMLLDLLRDALPEGSTIPDNFSKTKKIITDLGLNYHKIHACPNDCMLYWRETINEEACSICGASRWKMEDNTLISKKKKIPAKILRYFPLKPRLQRLFMSSKTASDMRWHEDGRTKDELLRHPADSLAWKKFDIDNPSFALEPRNVRLGLASDGFNPFGTMSIAHSTWPVVLIPYNLPPWMCMKQPYMILSLLIPGPHGPGNDIDVYLRPLIEELKDLWDFGLDTYDASKNETFKMRAALMWTISDFPGYAILSGWSTKGEFACPSCHKETCSKYLFNGRKFCYMGHRRFLPINHRFRQDKKSFDGTVELRSAPLPMSGSDALNQLKGITFKFNSYIERKRPREDKKKKKTSNWKKMSIFFELPYWKHNLLRHNLDVMHIEKNVSDNVLGTLLNIDGKSKDNLNARLDLVNMNVRHALHPQLMPNTGKAYLPTACFAMDKNEKKLFCEVLKSVRVPDGYSSNIARRVNVKEQKITGLKSHDSHVIMQQFLPLAVRKTLPKNVSSILIELSNFFRELCSKVCRVEELRRLEERIVLTLCHLERIFPPTFFDVMVHLPIHLAAEARLGGPVQYRGMYPIERYLYKLKSYVRNRAQPEGSIAEGYLADECMTFCSRYLQNIETRFNRTFRNCNDSAIGDVEPFYLSKKEWEQTHRYVLFNHEKVTKYIEQHMRALKMQYPRLRVHDIQKLHNDKFIDWFKNHVKLLQQTNNVVPEEIVWLSSGPKTIARRLTGYIQHGYRFRTMDKDQRRNSQNSGVAVTATTTSYASARDKRPIAGDVTYYGRLIDIIELEYSHLKFVLFKCDWVDVRANGRGIKIDEFGFTLVNFTRLLFQDQQDTAEPYVLASQAEQVFYVQDPVEPDWHVVVKTKPRDLFDMNAENIDDDADDNTFWENEAFIVQYNNIEYYDDDENVNWVREDVPGVTVDTY